MIKSLHILLIFSFLILCNSVFSQNVSDSIARTVNLKVLQLIDDYERERDIFNRNDYYDFVELFESENTLITNDILPVNELNKQIKVEKYPRKFSKYFDKYGKYKSSLSIKYIEPIHFNSYSKSGNVNVIIDKIINAENKNYDTYYSDTLRLRINVSFDSVNSEDYKINEIETLHEQGKYCFLEVYRKYLFNKTLMKNEKFIINNDTLKSNEKGRVFLKDVEHNLTARAIDRNIYQAKSIFFDSIGHFNEVTQDKNITLTEFRVPFLLMNGGVSYSPSFISPVSNDSDYYIIKTAGSTKNYNVNLGLGIIVYSNHLWQFSFQSGFSFQHFSYTLNLDKYEKSLIAIDPDDYEYQRNILVTNFQETQTLEYYSIPLKLNLQRYINNGWSVNCDLGIKLYKAVSGTFTSQASALYSGYYEDLYGITIAENGVYDFGSYDINGEGSLDMNKKIISINPGLNIVKEITRQYFLNVGINYEYSTDRIFENNKRVLSRNDSNLNSITKINNDFYIRNFNLNFGLIIKI